MAGDGIPSEPARQVTAEDAAEREKREAEKNATKASLNISAGAGTPAQTPVPAPGRKQSIAPVVFFLPSHKSQPEIAPLETQHKLCVAGKEAFPPPAPETGPKQYRAAAFDTPDSENPKKPAPAPETEAEFTRYQRQRTVRSTSKPYATHALQSLLQDICRMGSAAMFAGSAACQIVHINYP